jgi:hypothetical protein
VVFHRTRPDHSLPPPSTHHLSVHHLPLVALTYCCTVRVLPRFHSWKSNAFPCSRGAHTNTNLHINYRNVLCGWVWFAADGVRSTVISIRSCLATVIHSFHLATYDRRRNIARLMHTCTVPECGKWTSAGNGHTDISLPEPLVDVGWMMT